MDAIQNFALNVIASCTGTLVFLMSVYILVAFMQRAKLENTRKFLGVHPGESLHVYVPQLRVENVNTPVTTLLESEAANTIKNTLCPVDNGWLGRIATLLRKSINVEDLALQVEIHPAPLVEDATRITVQSYPRALLIIGGSLSNPLTGIFGKQSRYYFSPEQSKFAKRNKDGQPFVIEDSNSAAFLEKLVQQNRVVILAFGYGEKQTKAAVLYLASNLTELMGQFPHNQDFHIAFFVDEQGQAHRLPEGED